jgi:hypothetical protein
VRFVSLAVLLAVGAAYASVAAQLGKSLTAGSHGSAAAGVTHVTQLETTPRQSAAEPPGAGASGSDHVSVSVNGRRVSVPDNGELHQDISDQNSNTSLDISHHSSGAGNSSSLSVRLNSTSSTSTERSDSAD